MNDVTPVISVIVPVYNAVKYLPDCISSIQNQQMRDWELILVDDGSSDGSLSYCEACSRKDTRIKVFHKENGGVSSARNYGIQKARGTWITFIDADDLIPAGYFPESFGDIIDLYLTNVKYFPDSINTMWIEPCHIEETKDYLSFLEKNAHWVVLMAPWGKFIRREIIADNNILFDTRFRVCEDTLFDLQIETFCRSLEVTDSYYLYRYESLNDWRSKYSYTPKETLSLLDAFLAYYKDLGVNAPKLVSYVFSNISRMTDKTSMPWLLWITQPQVLEMKKLMRGTMNLKERSKYLLSRLLSCLPLRIPKRLARQELPKER